jgi:hypothetical protein
VAQKSTFPEGLLALLGQRATAKAIIAMLRDPSYQWTLDELAAQGPVDNLLDAAAASS